jgi:DNA-binding NarL/FixJ family response regulator
MVRTYITELLTDTPWRVCCEAADGSDALQKTRVLKPDLVLLDVSMPGTNGLEIAKIIRQELLAIKIVVASHHDLKQLLSSDAHQLADGFRRQRSNGLGFAANDYKSIVKKWT